MLSRDQNLMRSNVVEHDAVTLYYLCFHHIFRNVTNAVQFFPALRDSSVQSYL